MKSPSLLQPKIQFCKKEKCKILRVAPFLLCSLVVTSLLSFLILYSPNPFKISVTPKQDHIQEKDDVLIEPHITSNPFKATLTPKEEHLQEVTPKEDHLEKAPEEDHLQQGIVTPQEDHLEEATTISKEDHPQKDDILIQPHIIKDDLKKCDLSKGHWIPDLKGSLYTNSSCTTIPSSKNCFQHGRKDADFVNWRWKPDGCELPRFDPKVFLGLVRGKKLGFIGDSVARNHMESLLCLLSQEEIPEDIYKDSEDRFRTWYFPKHDFTLKIFWTKFLVVGEERVVNGSSTGITDLHLDRMDQGWTQHLPGLDYAIISSAHWFFRKMYIHEGNTLKGCVYCGEQIVKDLGVNYALRMAFRAALKYINNCKECKGMVTLLRTFSPAHFENGTWDTGGNCQRTSPYGEGEANLRGWEWDLRNIQVQEIERARKEGKKRGKNFGHLDVTRVMLMRPDGHPGSHWDNQWMKGYNDCVHWCLPGPIDIWNDFLLAVLSKGAFH